MTDTVPFPEAAIDKIRERVHASDDAMATAVIALAIEGARLALPDIDRAARIDELKNLLAMAEYSMDLGGDYVFRSDIEAKLAELENQDG